ncbi:hypothetical protein OK074_6880 [Actinobacteria bacterium OK074]|nr:hypothetical protein OK074_6880 [Actinobacteria bacterium OK074]
MVVGEKMKQRSDLREALQKLTYGLGVFRPDLLEALEGELKPLKECWEVSLRGGLAVARATITLNLHAHVNNLDVPKSTTEMLTANQKEERFRNSVLTSFNVARERWPDRDLKRRHEWLDKEASKNLKLSVSTSRRYLENALDQIEQQILASGYIPVIRDEDAQVGQQQESEEQSPRPANEPPVRGRRTTRRNSFIGAAAVASLALIAAVAVWAPWSNEKDSANPVKVVSVNQMDTGDYSWVFPAAREFSAADLRALDSNEYDKYRDWFKGEGAVPVKKRSDQIVLEGLSSQPVEIRDVQVEKKCQKAYSGTLFDNPNAGQNDSIQMFLNVDEQIPTPMDGYGKPYFPAHTISLKKGERSTIVVTASAEKYACKYTPKLKILVGDKETTQLVTDDGKPFEVSGKLSGEEETPYDKYPSVYVGGVLNTCGGPIFRKVEPKTYTSLDTSCS